MPRRRTRSRWRLTRDEAPGRARGTDRVAPPRDDDEGSAPESTPGPPRQLEVRMIVQDGDLARTLGATHVLGMQSQTKTQIVGFMELQVGSLAVQVPIRTAEPTPALPLASFEVEGDSYAILIRGDSSSKAVERAMGEAAREAITHLSRKLLN